jgi:hypothetical protein
MMQTDVKSTHLNASGSVYAARTRVKGIVIVANTTGVGTLVIKDGGSGGTTVIEIDVPANPYPIPFYVSVPGEGVLCALNAYASLTNVYGVTVFYG